MEKKENKLKVSHSTIFKPEKNHFKKPHNETAQNNPVKNVIR
jgi:hypothetical protein